MAFKATNRKYITIVHPNNPRRRCAESLYPSFHSFWSWHLRTFVAASLCCDPSDVKMASVTLRAGISSCLYLSITEGTNESGTAEVMSWSGPWRLLDINPTVLSRSGLWSRKVHSAKRDSSPAWRSTLAPSADCAMRVKRAILDS